MLKKAVLTAIAAVATLGGLAVAAQPASAAVVAGDPPNGICITIYDHVTYGNVIFFGCI